MESTKKRNSQYGFVRDLIATGLCLALLTVSVNASEQIMTPLADPETKIATSVGKPAAGTDNNAKRPWFDGPVASKARDIVSQSLNSGFEIYDAAVDLYYDDDYDGHFYGIEVSFDADTDYASARVFARLFLSFEGGPWEHYYTTDVFTLFGNSTIDTYEVDTELYSGYPTGYYDVLIELYDADYGDFVADFGPLETSELAALPLEDQARDAPIYYGGPAISVSHGSGGTSGLAVILLLGVLMHRHGTTLIFRRK